MKIKIEKTEKFAEKVTKEIKAVEGKARERLLTPDMIIEIVESVEKNLGIARRIWTA